MPIEAITGKPGNAKTAFLVKRILEEGKKADRPLWASGIDGLKPGLCSVFKDPKEWNAVRPGETCTCSDTEDDATCDAHVIPNGSLIFIDEAWKWFGHLHDASRQPTPLHVLQLAEHRHRGIDFVWTFQQPAQIYPFARGMIADHQHLVRRFGTMFCDSFKWGELCEDVKSITRREQSDRSIVAIPKESFGLYKSAEVHTIKRKIPVKLWALPVMLAAALGLVVVALQLLQPDTATASTAEGRADGLPAAGLSAEATAGTDEEEKFATLADYITAHSARIGTLPWSAPIFDGRDAAADPEFFCMASGAGTDANGGHRAASVTCLTEQGTPYHLPEDQARHFARWGSPYNPYKAPDDEQDSTSSDGPSLVAGAPLTASLSTSQVNGYGDLGVRLNPGP